MKNQTTILVYTLATFTSVTAYEVYASFLANYNFGWAIFGFQFLFILTVKILYPYLERTALSFLHITDKVGEQSIKEAFRRQPKAIMYLGTSSCIKFSLMLPFLQNLHNSLLFIIFFALAGIAKVPVAMRVFGDKILNPRIYWIGLLVATLGSISYSIDPNNPQKIFDQSEWFLLLLAIIKTPLEIIDSILSRYITTQNVAKDKVITVGTLEEIKAYITTGFGLILGIYALLTDPNLHIIPTSGEMFGILWIGIVVTLSICLSLRLLIEITHSVTQPIQSIRPLLAFIPMVYAYFTFGGNGTEILYKLACIIVILTGVGLCMKYGNPITKTVKVY